MTNNTENNNGPKGEKEMRNIDVTTSEVLSFWKKTFVFIQKTRIKTWQGVFILAFIAGVVAAIIWTVSLNIQTSSKAAGETADLYLLSDDTTIDVGSTFPMDIMMNSHTYGVVAVKAIVDFDKDNFSLEGYDIKNSSAFQDDNNYCQTAQEACEIVQNDASNGKITITVSKPSPGMSSETGITIARLYFKANNVVSPSQNNFSINYTKGSYDDSDVILDDGLGTDILTAVTGTTISVAAPACTFTFNNDWGTCAYNATANDYLQTQTYTKSPEGCAGEPDEAQITRECDHPACTTVTPGNWGTCTEDANPADTLGTQTRTLTVGPELCTMTSEQISSYPTTQSCSLPKCTYDCQSWTDITCAPDRTSSLGGRQARTCTLTDKANECYVAEGDPVTTRECTPEEGTTACTTVNYQPWSEVACLPDTNSSDSNTGLQTRTVTVEPSGCTIDANDVQNVQRSCTAPDCTYSYSEFGACQANNTQTRTVTASPSFCKAGNPESATQSCSYQAPVEEKKKDSHDDDKDDKDKKKKSSDKTKPTLDIPLFLNKYRGSRVWWTGKDNKGIDYYTYSFAGKKGKTKATSFNIPPGTPKGVHMLTLRAYDKAGNMTRKYVMIRVR